MISLTRPNGYPVVLDPNLIVRIDEEGESSVITLSSGKTVVVRDSARAVRERIVEVEARTEGPDSS